MSKDEPATQASEKKTREQRFVESVIERCRSDKGLAARLRRADNPSTEYQSWEFLGNYGIDLEKDYERVPFATVASAIAKSKAEKIGSLTLGKALSKCYDDGSNSNQAKAKMRRLLACRDLMEVARVLRPLLALIDSKLSQPLDFVRLLRQLRFFEIESGQKTKTQWAQEFYSPSTNSKTDKDAK